MEKSKDNRFVIIVKIEKYIGYMLTILLKLPRTEKFSIGTEVKTSINNEVGITVYGYPSGIGASEDRKIKFTVKIQRRNF